MADKSTWRNAGPDGDSVIQCTSHYKGLRGGVGGSQKGGDLEGSQNMGTGHLDIWGCPHIQGDI